MNFQKVELHGFKSFADKTVIPFKEGMTGIIGPNGCGKSNVVDAVRWVLGEQSAKMLRGGSMQDVIFKGTEARRGLSYCEVSLFFDNTKRIFPTTEQDEVVISRRLDRSGKSEYFINKKRTRLKDIMHMLFDTGISTDGYTIIGQSKVQDIMSAKPENRRIIFEDAAGVSSFKNQKEEAERKLERAQVNIDLYSNIIKDVEDRLPSMARKAENARKYKDLASELKKNEVNLYIYQYENNQTVVDAINARLDRINAEMQIAEAESKRVNDEYDINNDNLSHLDADLAAVNDELRRKLVSQASSSSEQGAMSERMEQLSTRIETLNTEIAGLQATLDERAGQLSELVVKTPELSENLAAMEAELKAAAAEYDEVSNYITSTESELERSQREILEKSNELMNIRSNLGALLAEKEINSSRLESMTGTIKVKKETLDAECANKAIYEANIAKLMSEGRTAAARLQELYATTNECKESIESLREDISRATSRVSALETRYTTLQNQKKEYDGYKVPIKRLMQDAQVKPDLGRAILGSVAELIKVPSGLEEAMEAAIGASQQDVIVPTDDDATFLINYLKSHNYGTITFLPLNVYKARRLEARNEAALSEHGVVGVASELVSYDRKYDVIVKGLLGATVVVDTIENAKRIARRFNYDFRIVTVDGNIINTTGAFRGGSHNDPNASRFFTKEKEMEESKKLWDDAIKQHKRLVALEAEKSKTLVESERECHELELKIRDISVSVEYTKNNLKRSEETIEAITGEVKSQAQEMEDIGASIRDTDQKVSSIDKLEAEVAEQRTVSGELMERSKLSSGEGKQKKDELNSKIMSLRVDIAQTRKILDGYGTDTFRLKHECEGVQQNLLNKKSELAFVSGELSKTEAKIKTIKLTDEDAAALAALQTKLAELTAAKKSLSETVQELYAKRGRLTDTIRDLDAKRFNEQNALTRADSDIKTMQEVVWNNYNLTYQNALPLKVEDYDHVESQAAIAKLRRSMMQLGTVNLLAVEEYDEELKNYEEKKKVLSDFEKGKADILQIIADITEEMEAKFKDAFDQINANFGNTFKQLFGGGSAKLVMLSPKTGDPLDAGVDIMAQPPGKKLQQLSLLSGGEQAFTAIAILFAILQLKPMPFCILDEVDAALDDSNCHLFGEYLKTLSVNTQFIVVTHKKPTMEFADSLLGVTMEEKGVTKIITVDFVDVDAYIEED